MQNFKKIALMMSASALLASTPASAATFLFTYDGTDATEGFFSAALTLEETAGTVTAISGLRNGAVVTGLSAFASAAQSFNPTNPFTNVFGISYSAGGSDYNVFFADPNFGLPGGLYELSSLNDPTGGDFSKANAITVSVAAVPEPATWALLLLGFFAVGGAMRAQRRKPNVSVSFA